MRFRLPAYAAAPALLSVLLVLAACSSDDVGGLAGPTSSPTPSATDSSGLGGAPAPSVTPPTPGSPGSSASPAPTPYDGPPRTYDEAVALVTGASGTRELRRFASPTGNLYCVLDSPYLPPACELAEGAIPDSVACPDAGPSQSVGRIEFTGSAPSPVCNSDTIREPGAPVLDYGIAATWPDTTVTCVMQEAGVTCVDPAVGRGYTLARGRYQVF